MSSLPGDSESRQKAYHLARHVIEHGTTNGVTPEECGGYEEEAEALVNALEQQGKEHAQEALDELESLRRFLNTYDPETDGYHPLGDLRGITAADLLQKDLPPLEYVVEGVIPEGASLLAAAPKIGKSLLCLNIAVAVALDGKALGKADVQTGRVLYIDLDGNMRGTQRRLKSLLKGESKADTLDDLQRFDYYREFPRVDEEKADDAIGYLERYLERYDDTRLVVVDTLADVRPKTSGQRNMYETDREALTPFRDLLQKHNTSGVFVHHTNKSNASDPLEHVSGSTGLTSAVDNVLVMRKERGQHDAELQIVPREEEEQTLSLSFDPQLTTWRLEGQAEEFAKTEERQEVLDALRDLTNDGQGDPVGPKEVSEALPETSYDTVRQRLSRMAEAEESRVEKPATGKYLPKTPSHPSHPSHPSQSEDDREDPPF